MEKPRIVIDDKIPYIKGLLDEVAEVRYLPYGKIVHEAIEDAECIVIRTRTKCGSELLEGTKVRAIVTATIGMDHVDAEYCRKRGITVRNAPGCNAGSVTQWVREALGVWGKTGRMGVVGVGNVGSRVKIMAEQMGFEVMVSDPPLGYMTTLEQLAERCDVITFHTPLTVDGDYPTLRMAGEGFFDRMAKDGLVINAARGGIVDERAMKRWLSVNREARCAIDCWESEPEIDRELLEMAMIATPHIAGYSADGKWNGTRLAVEAVNDLFGIKGELPKPLPAVGEYRYDIRYDSELLKHNPERFEWFRGNYRERRE